MRRSRRPLTSFTCHDCAPSSRRGPSSRASGLPSTRPRSWTRTAAAPRGLRGWRGWAALSAPRFALGGGRARSAARGCSAAARPLGGATHVLLHHTLHRQLRRSAYEAEDVELLSRACAVKACDAACASADEGTNEGADDDGLRGRALARERTAALPAPLHPDAAPADACDGLAGHPLCPNGEALERLRARRALAAGDDEAAALKKKEELVDQLRAKDPKAEVDVTHEEQGTPSTRSTSTATCSCARWSSTATATSRTSCERHHPLSLLRVAIGRASPGHRACHGICRTIRVEARAPPGRETQNQRRRTPCTADAFCGGEA